MAYGDKKTILDLVKNVEGMTKRHYSNDPDISKFLHNRRAEELEEEKKDLSKLKKDVLEEKDPTAGGTYEGSVYYSNILPKGKGDLPWSKEASLIVGNAAKYNAKKSDILKAQNYFVDIGYMHKSEVDGYKGKQLQGMISRWNKNAGSSVDAVKDAIRDFKIFGE